MFQESENSLANYEPVIREFNEWSLSPVVRSHTAHPTIIVLVLPALVGSISIITTYLLSGRFTALFTKKGISVKLHNDA